MSHSPVKHAVLALSILAVLASGGWPGAVAGAQGQGTTPDPFPGTDLYPAEVTVASATDWQRLVDLRIDVDGVRAEGGVRIATVWIVPAEAARLAQAGLAARPIPNESLAAFRRYGPGTVSGPQAWPTYAQYVARMQGIANAYPGIVRMVSIGQSGEGRDIWFLKISDNPDVAEDEPEVKYTAAIHGDETTGTEMTVRLAELLTGGYGVTPTLTALVDGMEIWLCPMSNPDGYVHGWRGNADPYVDLNRDFPDQWVDPNNTTAGREIETARFMNFEPLHHFVMGANYHGGAQVANYPFDGCPGANCNTNPVWPSDVDVFYQYSLGYAARNPDLLAGGFTNGVTMGWQWYDIYGGMQDWAYHWYYEHHITLEISNTKKPSFDTMGTYWDHNRDAMLWWFERALMGARGLVTDSATGAPLAATIAVTEFANSPVATDPAVGDYHRLLLPGNYTLNAHAEGYCDQSAPVTVISGTATIQNFALVQETASGCLPYHVYAPLHQWGP